MRARIRSARRMSKLPPELLLQWGVPLWRQRQREVPENFSAPALAASEMAEKSPEKASAGVFQGFFVPDALDDASEALLQNILQVFPQLGARHAISDVTPLLAAESGTAVIFGTPEWLEDAETLPLTPAVLPSLDDMLEQPLLKKQAYLQLLALYRAR